MIYSYQDLKFEYEISELDNFSFLKYDDFLNLKCMSKHYRSLPYFQIANVCLK